ncbi:MAG: hypothetical protein IKQ78_05515 [Bacilli bacterium]|nr:hypothetical protein [Bacilli bacterium]
MKKNNLLLALLASSLILTSCGGDDKPADESAKEAETSQQSGDSTVASGEPGTTSEPEISVDTRSNADKIKDLFALMASGKSSTVEYNGYTTEFYGEDKGIWNEVPASDTESESSGVAVIPNYGIYSVSWDDASNEYYLAGIMTPNTTLDIGDVQYTTVDLGKAAASITFAESSRTHTFSTEDAAFCTAMLGVLGASSLSSVYAGKKVSFNVNEDGSALTNVSLSLTQPTDSQYKATTIEGMKISKIGTTTNLDFEVLITNPGISARTTWTSYELQYFAHLHASFTLPFPTGASYAVNVSVLEEGEFCFQDLGCGNRVNAYKTQLEGAGFTQNDDYTDTAKGIFAYEKTLEPATATVGALKEIVRFTWVNDASQAVYYPNGQFIVIAYPKQELLKITVAELTTLLTSKTLSDGTQYWPDMAYDNCTGAAVEDLTEDAYDYYYYYGYETNYYAFINLYYATEAQAIAAANYINTQLGKNGYVANTSNGTYTLSTTDPYTYDSEDVIVRAQVAYDDNGNYLGYVEVLIWHYIEESWY